tara:strand:- start:752 stop:928 length:177 start_codon:yes stop_codon:yes gene_type:complete
MKQSLLWLLRLLFQALAVMHQLLLKHPLPQPLHVQPLLPQLRHKLQLLPRYHMPHKQL